MHPPPTRQAHIRTGTRRADPQIETDGVLNRSSEAEQCIRSAPRNSQGPPLDYLVS